MLDVSPWPAPWPGRVHCMCPFLQSAEQYSDASLSEEWTPHSGSCVPVSHKCNTDDLPSLPLTPSSLNRIVFRNHLTFPLHLLLLMIFRAYSRPVDLSTHSRTTAKFPSPIIRPTLYLSAMEAGTWGQSSIGSARRKDLGCNIQRKMIKQW